MVTKICLLLVMALLIVGCEKKESPTVPVKEHPAAASAQEHPADAQVSKIQTECPIMGGKINKDIFVDYEGKRVYFCCAGCEESFKKDAPKYIKQMEGKGITLTKAK